MKGNKDVKHKIVSYLFLVLLVVSLFPFTSPIEAQPVMQLLDTIDDGTYYGVCVTDDYIFTACYNEGVRAYTFDGTSLTLVDTQDDGSYYTGVASYGSYVFVACSIEGLRAYTFSGGNFVLKDTEAGFTCVDLFINDSYIYAACVDSGIKSYTFDGTSLTLVDTQDDGGGGFVDYNSVYGDGTYIYVTSDGGAAIYAYSVSSGVFTLKGSYGSTAFNVWCNSSYIFASRGTSGIQAFTFDGSSFALVETGNSYQSYALHGNGTLIYSSDATNNIVSYSFSLGSGFTVNDYLDGSGNPVEDMFCDSSYLYVAQRDTGLFVYTSNIIIPTTQDATSVTTTTATLNGVAYGADDMTCGFWYNATGISPVNVSCAGTFDNGETFSKDLVGLTVNKKYNVTAWAFKAGIGFFNSSTVSYFYTDLTPPVIVINFAGNLSDKGGPFWRPPGETTQLTGVFSDGYYTNDSYQHEDFIYINCTITDIPGGLGVDKVYLHWYNYTADSWLNTSELTNTGGTYWEINKTSVPAGKYSFDIWANDTANNINLTWWNKTRLSAGITRRYVHLNNTPTSIEYTPLYLYGMSGYNGTLISDFAKRDRFQKDGGTGGYYDTGALVTSIPLDLVVERGCSSFVGYWYGSDECIQPLELNNVLAHIWYSTENINQNAYFVFAKSRSTNTIVGGEKYLFDDTENRSIINYIHTTPISPFDDTFYLINKVINLTRVNFTDSNFTDNNIYEFLFNIQANYPMTICNRSFTSYLMFNIPDNATLNASHSDTDGDGLSDWTELYITFTNPFLSDTDNDGQSDYNEVFFGYDPNNYLNGSLASYYTVLPPTNLVNTVYGTTTIAVNMTWTPGINATNTTIRRSSTAQPVLPTDGTEVYNGTGTFFNDTGLSIPYYYTLFSWNETLNEFSTGVFLEWYVALVNAYDSVTGDNITNYSVFITHPTGSPTLSVSNCNNPQLIGTSTIPTGDDVLIRISRTGYQDYVEYRDIEITGTSNYVINGYLSPVETPSIPPDEGGSTEDCTLMSKTDSIAVSNPAVNVVISTSFIIEEIVSIEIYNDSLYGSYGGWLNVPSTYYTSNSTNITILHAFIDVNTSQARVTYYYWYCPGITTPMYRLRVIDEKNYPIPNAFVEIKKYLNTTGAYVTVGTLYTNGYGEGDIFLLSNTAHKVFITKTGYENITGSDWLTDPTYYGASYPKVFQMQYTDTETQPPIFEFEDITFTGVLVVNATTGGYDIQITYLDIQNYTLSTYMVVRAFNFTTNTSTVIQIHTTVLNSSWSLIIPNIDRNMTYYGNLTYIHQYLGMQNRFFIVEKQINTLINETRINELFDFIGVVPFGISNGLLMLLWIAGLYYADGRDAGKITIILGVVFLFIGFYIGIHSPLTGGTGIIAGGSIPGLILVLGLLMEWNNSKKKV